ncbi:MAG: hypothetical protein C4289_04390 [Chloroflexota bacterium]
MSLPSGRSQLIPGDVTDRRAVHEGMCGCNCVVHLANVYSFWEPDRRVYWEVNVAGKRNVLEAALDLGVSKVVRISTTLVSGKPRDCLSTEESQPGTELFSEHARSKAAGDRLAWELFQTRGLPLVVVYPVGVPGPGNSRVSSRYIRNILERRLPALGSRR